MTGTSATPVPTGSGEWVIFENYKVVYNKTTTKLNFKTTDRIVGVISIPLGHSLQEAITSLTEDKNIELINITKL